MVEQHAVDPTLPGLDEVIGMLVDATFKATTATPYEAEIARTTQRVLVENLMTLAAELADAAGAGDRQPRAQDADERRRDRRRR